MLFYNLGRPKNQILSPFKCKSAWLNSLNKVASNWKNHEITLYRSSDVTDLLELTSVPPLELVRFHTVRFSAYLPWHSFGMAQPAAVMLPPRILYYSFGNCDDPQISFRNIHCCSLVSAEKGASFSFLLNWIQKYFPHLTCSDWNYYATFIIFTMAPPQPCIQADRE